MGPYKGSLIFKTSGAMVLPTLKMEVSQYNLFMYSSLLFIINPLIFSSSSTLYAVKNVDFLAHKVVSFSFTLLKP